MLSNLLKQRPMKTEEEIYINVEKMMVWLLLVLRTRTDIDPEIMPRLFEKFASKSYQGTGLGLYMQKHCRSPWR
jgi:hypothetical protein